MGDASTDTNLRSALDSLDQVKTNLRELTKANWQSQSMVLKLTESALHLGFAQGILFAETSLSEDDWKALIKDLS